MTYIIMLIVGALGAFIFATVTEYKGLFSRKIPVELYKYDKELPKKFKKIDIEFDMLLNFWEYLPVLQHGNVIKIGGLGVLTILKYALIHNSSGKLSLIKIFLKEE